jgi:hypothetical protein
VTANDPKPDQRGDAPEQTEGDVPNAGPVSHSSGRDFGDSAGYGTGGSTRDYREVVGEDPATDKRPNPLDAVIPPEPDADQEPSQS